MCETIIINNGERELRTANDFKEYFKIDFPIPENAVDAIDGNCCLCQIDIQKELKKLGISFEYDGCDYNISSIANRTINGASQQQQIDR